MAIGATGKDREDVRHPTPEWYRRKIRGCFNADEIERLMKLIKKNSPKDALNVLLSTFPKEIKQDNQGVIVNLSLNGVMHKQFIQANALPEHEDGSGDS